MSFIRDPKTTMAKEQQTGASLYTRQKLKRLLK